MRQPGSSRFARCALRLALAGLAMAAACRSAVGPSGGLSLDDVEALKRSIAQAQEEGERAPAPGAATGVASERQQGDGASPAAPASSAGESSAGEASAAATGRPPRDDAERAARARRAFPAGVALSEPSPVAGDGRYVFALAGTGGSSHLRLVLLDVAAEDPVVIGEHDFGPAGPGRGGEVRAEDAAPSGAAGAVAAAEPGGSAVPAPDAPPHPSPAPGASAAGATISRTMEIIADGGDPVLLAEVHGGPESAACGWWLRRRGTRFVCAPGIGGASSYANVDGFLVESWTAELPGKGGLERASGASGRMLRIYGGRWREADRFECLAWPLADALREAGPAGVGAWQQASEARLAAAARRAGEGLETERAIALLVESIAIDACVPDTWRVLGRLEFESGRVVRAAPALAVGLALAPRDAAAMVDLADALAVLNAGPAAGAESLRETVAALDSHGTTRAIVDAARARAGGPVPPPRPLARALYAAFLESTDPSDPRLEAARRRAEDEIARLAEAPRAASRSKSRAAAKPKASTAAKAAAKR